jgi:hypothetical protein
VIRNAPLLALLPVGVTFTMIKSLVPTALFTLALVPGTAAIQPVPISAGNYRITEPGQYVLVQDVAPRCANRAIRNA